MKLNIKSLSVFIIFMIGSLAVKADPIINIKKLLDGNTVSESSAVGNISTQIIDNKCKLTVTPASGNYITAENITYIKTINGSYALTRAPGLDNTVMPVTALTHDVDPSGETTYEFAIDGIYDYEITADFQSRKSINDATITFEKESYTYTGKALEPTVTVKLGETTLTYQTHYTLSYLNNTIVGNGTVTLTGQGIYTGSASATFTITPANMTVTAEGYKGAYDNKAHGITVTAPEGATVKYGTQEGTYDLTASPTYTDAGTYIVYYQVTKENYTTITGNATVEISKANITPTVTLDGWTYGTTAKTPSIAGNSGNGNVTYTYKAEGSETFVDTKPEAVGTHTIKASIAETTNYNAGEATATFTITAANMTVTAEGYKGTYDTKAHGITVTSPEGSTVKYGSLEGTYDLTESPKYTDAGTYIVYYQVTKENYTTIAGSATVEISKADITPTVTLEGWTYGTTAKTPSIAGNSGNGNVTYTYKAEGSETFVDTKPEAVGTHTIKASIAETTNYNAGEATATFTITAATMNVTAEGYKGTYDTKAHGITVTSPEGSTVKYGSLEGTYNLTESPKYTDAGTYQIHYQVTMDNYTTTTGSATVEISKADITPTVTLEGWTYGTTANTPSITGNTGNGTVTYTYKAEGAEEFTENMPEVVGTHTIKASIAESTNYNAGEATATFTITAATTPVTAKGYKGAFNNQPHGITITAPEGATVKYGTQKGKYELTESPTYTDAGTYKIHYQVTRDNYTTITDSATVEISKADITPTVTLEGWTYGTTAKTPSIAGNSGNGNVTYTYKAEDADTFTEKMPEVVGTHTIKASIAETTNYNAGEATATFTITAANMTVTAEGFKGTYDNKAHGITVTAPENATVKYGTQKGTYNLSASPTYTDAGTYKVHYQVTMDNYTTVTDSATVEISKAAGGLEYSTATASAELNSDGWTAPELKNPNSLAVTYTSSNTDVAKISETGVVTLVGAGETTIKAASEGDTNHEACEAQYVLTVSQGKTQGYGVWVGETEVDKDNCEDILNDGEKDNDGEYTKIPSFIFNPDENTLLIINSDAGLTIESRIPELKIHLSNDNKLKKIFYNNQGKSENTGTLLFTCDSNFPGSVTIGNTVGESAISGFTSVSYEFSLQALKPAKAKYTNGQMTDSLGVVADTITVGTPLKPIQNNDKEELDADDFTVTNPDGSSATLDLTSANVNDIYYTLPESTEGQGYDPETNTINVVDPMTDDAVEQIAAATTNKNATVGTSEYAESFVGLTFIVQGGEGVIRIDQETEEGYEFHLKIGDKPSIALKSGKEEIEYSLPDATYCWLYLVRNAALARGGTRVNKRDHTPGNIRLIKVQSKTVASTKSAKAASGGAISPKANNAITGIVDINKDTPENKFNAETVNDKWYTIDGRRIDKPTKKGLYIRNRKKVVVK